MSAEYQPVQIVDLKIHMLRAPDNGTPSGLLRLITDQGIEGWSNEVTADMAHALRGEAREWLVGADAMARLDEMGEPYKREYAETLFDDKGIEPPGRDPKHMKVRSIAVVLDPKLDYAEACQEDMVAAEGKLRTTV